MTIKARPFESGGGGGASVPDASESTKGKIKISTTSEATAGTDDLTAMTPAKVKARIDAALVGGVEYKGSYTGQSLVTAEKGDLYVSAATYSLAGVQVLSGDHIIFNQDAADPVTSAMFDKIDNTDQVSSVNTLTGAVVLSGANLDGDHNSPSNYSVTTDKIEKHLEGIDTEFANRQPLNARLTDVAGLTPNNNHVIVGDSSNFTAAQLASTQLSDSADLARLASPALTGTPTGPTATSGTNTTQLATTAFVQSAVSSAGGNQITDIEEKSGSTFTAEANHLYICGYTSGTQTITFPDASSSSTGDIIGLSTFLATRSVSIVSSDGTTNDIKNNSNQTKGGTLGALSLNIHRQISWFVSDGALWLETNAALSTVATTGAYSDLSGTPSLATVATSGAYSDLSGTPSLATVATSGAYSDLSGTPTVPSALTDLSDVTIGTAASGEVLRYSGSAWVDAQLAYSDLSGTPSLATVATSGAYSDLSGTPSLGTASANATTDFLQVTNDLSDLNNAGTARTNLGLAIGSDVQAFNARLTDVAGLTPSNNHVIVGDSSNFTAAQLASTQLSDSADLARLASPALTGSPTAPTQSQSDGSTKIATTAYVDTAVSGAGGGVTPTLTVRNSTSYTLTSSNAKGIHIWYGADNTTTFTVTMPDIADVISTATTSDGDPQETFEVYVGRARAGDITISAADGIDVLGDGVVTYSTTQTVVTGQWIKIIGWYFSSGNKRYLMNGAAQAYDAGLQSISGLTTAADKMLYTTGSDTYAVTDLTSAGRALLDDADAAAQRTTLGLVIGTDVLSDLVQDTSPQLGGDLDLNGQDIVTTSNANLELAPDGTGVVSIKGNTTGGSNQGAIKLWCENNSHGISIKSPPHSATASYELVLPTGVGTDGQVLKTDGGDGGTPNSVQLAWVDQASGGGGWTYSAITADPANAQAGYHYSCTGTFTITLPTSGVSAGEEIRVKNMGSGTVTIDPQTQNIDGATTDYVMDVQYGAITLVSTGSHWEII